MVLFSWLVIGVAALIFGKAIIDTVYRKDIRVLGRLDIYLVAGIIFLNVYAQFFSIIYKVAGIACAILGLIGIVLAAWYAVKVVRHKENPFDFSYIKRHPYRTTALFICMVVTAVWTVQDPGHYDTGLYHAQAIRWVEEYGVVLGLGNLHMRLAYNSAFMCLQALCSLQWLLGQSVHSLNGFFCILCLGYAVMTVRIHGERLWRTSDLLKCFMVIYIESVRYNISSSGTDIWALLLVLYICTKWCEFTENKVESASPWCFTCLVGMYALTVKLSTAVIVLLTIYPLYLLIRKKDFIGIIKNAVMTILIVLPFLIRNVMISGYLIYPYSRLDLFDVDWKMDKAVLISDSTDIKMYGRGTVNENQYNNAILEWIPGWFGRQRIIYQLLILIGILCVCAAIVRIWKYIRAGRIRETVFEMTAVLSLIFWLVMAPLIRYGVVYFFVIIAIVVGDAGRRMKSRNKYEIFNIVIMLTMVPILGIYIGGLEKVSDVETKFWLKQADYLSWHATQYQVGNVSIWFPDESDLIGYFAFPATSQKRQMQQLELRGDGFKDGFRCNAEAESDK